MELFRIFWILPGGAEVRVVNDYNGGDFRYMQACKFVFEQHKSCGLLFAKSVMDGARASSEARFPGPGDGTMFVIRKA